MSSQCEACNQLVPDESLQYDFFNGKLLCPACTIKLAEERVIRYRAWYASHWAEYYGSIETRNQWNETFEEWLTSIV